MTLPSPRGLPIEQPPMIYAKDVVECVIPQADMEKIVEHARAACIGGRSNIRTSSDRENHLLEDQLVGQIATYCGSVVLTGSPEGWSKARDIANAKPHSGDGGVDIVGLDNVDIKGSLMRKSRDPLEYRLLVRPRERHVGWIYVLGLVPKSRPYRTHLVGWACDDDLPKTPNSRGAFKGAYVVKARNLRSISGLQRQVRSRRPEDIRVSNQMTVVCPLPPRQLSPNSRCHWRTRHKHSKKYREECRVACFTELVSRRRGDVDWENARLQATFYYKDRRRRDRDNMAAMLKYSYDGIASALGVDDYGFRPQMPEVKVDKDRPRVEIVVIGNDPPGDPSPDSVSP